MSMMKYEKGDSIVTRRPVDTGGCAGAVPQGTLGTVHLIIGAMVYCRFEGQKQPIGCSLDEIDMSPPAHVIEASSVEDFRNGLLADLTSLTKSECIAFTEATNKQDKRYRQGRLSMLRDLILRWQQTP